MAMSQEQKQQRQELLLAVVENPTDAAAKHVLADHMEEFGEADLAYALHWCAHRGRHPFMTPGGRTCCWQRTHKRHRGAKLLQWLLPWWLHDCMAKTRFERNKNRSYAFLAALRAVAEVLKTLREGVAMVPAKGK